MQQKVVYLILAVSFIGLFVVGEAQKPGIAPPPDTPLRIDIVSRDLMKITSFSPGCLEVQNVSDEPISGFSIKAFASKDERSPVQVLRWGFLQDGKNLNRPILKRNESVSVPITPETFESFIKYARPFLYIQLADVWTTKYQDMSRVHFHRMNYYARYRVFVNRDAQ